MCIPGTSLNSLACVCTYICCQRRRDVRDQCFFSGIFAHFSPAPVGLLSRYRLRRTQGAHLYTTAQVWVPGVLLGAGSGRSKSRNMESNHGVAFREARAEQDKGKPACQLFCCTAVKALLGVSHGTTAVAHQVYVDHDCVDIACACLFCACYDTCACV